MTETLQPGYTVVSPQNSSLRLVTANIFNDTAVAIDRHAPWITPDMITLGTTAMHVECLRRAASAESVRPRLAWTAAAGLCSLGDALDGALARHKSAKTGVPLSEHGGNVDLAGDRAQEIAGFLFTAVRAGKHSKTAFLANVGATLTAPLPSLARARAEAHGVAVEEFALGSRAVRAGAAMVGIAGGNRLAAVTGIYAAVTNSLTAAKRFKATGQGSPHAIGLVDGEVRSKAERRYRLTKKIAWGAGALALGVALSGGRKKQARVRRVG